MSRTRRQAPRPPLRGPERLEDRITPIIGDLDLPFVADPYVSLGQDNLAGISSYNGGCTAALLDRGGVVIGSRHLLLAAHCLPAVGDTARFFLPAEPGGSPDGTLRQIEILVSAVWVHPDWTGDVNDNLNDIAVVTLENVAPFGASYYEIYTDDQAAVTPEVGQPFLMAGYGETGNGTMGQFATVRGELQRLRVNAAGGTYILGLDGVFTAPIAFNANAAAIEAALEAALGLGLTVRDVTSGPHVGSVEILFSDDTTDRSQLVVDATALTGTALINTIQDGGARPLRLGQNEYDGEDGTTLVSDFDNDGTDTFEGVGDSGGPGFFDLGGGNLAIASVVSHGGFVYGDTENNTKVSLFTDDILAQINAGPYALVLDMADQVAGDNGEADEIVVRLVGGNLQLVVDGNIYYQDALANLTSVLVRGSGDAETIILEDDLGIGVSVEAGDGDDVFVVQSAQGAGSLLGGGLGNDTLRGEAGAGLEFQINNFNEGSVTFATLLPFAEVENLIGGAQGDTFLFGFGGQLSGNVDGGGGSDTLNYSPFFSSATTNLQTHATSGIDGTFAGIERLVGSSSADTLVGENNANVWTINAPDAGDVDGFLFEGVENLTGASAADVFLFQAGGTSTGNLDGAAGADTLNFAAVASQAITLTAQGATDGFSGTRSGGTFANIDAILGSGAGDDRLTGADALAHWDVTATDAGRYDQGGRTLDFTGFEFLDGGAADDTFTLNAGTRISGRIDGRGSKDTLRALGHAGADHMVLRAGRLTFNTLDTLFSGVEVARLIGLAGNDRFTARFDQGHPVPALGMSVNGGAGYDLLTTVGSALNEALTLTPGFLRANARAISYLALEQMDLFAGGGNDVFDARFVHYQPALAVVRYFGEAGDDTATLAPSATTRFLVHGGAPARPTFPGDGLFFVNAGQLIQPPVVFGNGGSDGLYLFKNRRAVQFVSIERGAGGNLDLQPWV